MTRVYQLDALLAHALAAQMAGQHADPVALARQDENAREARMRNVKAVQRHIDEERKKVRLSTCFSHLDLYLFLSLTV